MSLRLDVKVILRSDTRVPDTIQTMTALKVTSVLDGGKKKILRLGGAITRDGVRVEEPDTKYYDFVANYVQFEKLHSFMAPPKWPLR